MKMTNRYLYASAYCLTCMWRSPNFKNTLKELEPLVEDHINSNPDHKVVISIDEHKIYCESGKSNLWNTGLM